MLSLVSQCRYQKRVHDSHVYLSKVGPYIFYKDMEQLGPGKELESEVHISLIFKGIRYKAKCILISFSNVHLGNKCISDTNAEAAQ